MKTDLDITSKPSSIDELIQNVEKHPDMYRHLQIFFSRERPNGSPAFGEEYLAVTTVGFALYQLNDIDYMDGKIILTLKETTTSEVETYTLDINDKNPKCVFLRWKDIRNMVLNEGISSDKINDELLEFV